MRDVRMRGAVGATPTRGGLLHPELADRCPARCSARALDGQVRLQPHTCIRPESWSFLVYTLVSDSDLYGSRCLRWWSRGTPYLCCWGQKRYLVETCITFLSHVRALALFFKPILHIFCLSSVINGGAWGFIQATLLEFSFHTDALYIQIDKRYGDMTDTFGYAQAW